MTMYERERTNEDHLVRKAKALGGEVRKAKWLGRRGAPDRVLALHGLHPVEVKSPGKWLDPHQWREHKRLMAQGCIVYTVDTKAKIDLLLVFLTEGVHV